MTPRFGLVLPEKMWKVEGVAPSDSRGIPRGPYAGPSDPPVAPQNPTWGPTTQDEGPWAERRPSSTWLRPGSSCRDMGELAHAPHSAGSTFASLTLQASAQPARLLTPILSIPPTYNASSPQALGNGLYLNCLCLFFSCPIWEFRAEIRSLHSCSMVCFLARGKAAVMFSECLPRRGLGWGFRVLLLRSVLTF